MPSAWHKVGSHLGRLQEIVEARDRRRLAALVGKVTPPYQEKGGPAAQQQGRAFEAEAGTKPARANGDARRPAQ